jgi:hypothetical protein
MVAFARIRVGGRKRGAGGAAPRILRAGSLVLAECIHGAAREEGKGAQQQKPPNSNVRVTL